MFWRICANFIMAATISMILTGCVGSDGSTDVSKNMTQPIDCDAVEELEAANIEHSVIDEELIATIDNNVVALPEGDLIGIDTAPSWQLRGTANVTLTLGDTVYIGGDFNEIFDDTGGALPRQNLAALNRLTGQPTSFAPKLDGEVWALALSSDLETLYIAGAFLNAEGLTRERIAAYDVASGALTSFVTPTFDNTIRTIAVQDNKVYLGGLFTEVGTVNQPFLAAFDSTTGALDKEFQPVLDARVTSLIAGVDRIWLGGDFNEINNHCQQGIAAIDSTDGSLLVTDEVPYPVLALAASDTQIFIAGGGFGGMAAAFSRTTGLQQWEIVSDGNFQAVAVQENGRFVYFGGHYETIEEDDRVDRMSRHNKATGETDFSWLPRINGITSVAAISITADSLHIGGDFTLVNSEPQEGFATILGQTF